MKAYKVFNSNWTCRNFQYEVGKTYKHEGEISLCNEGFQACVKAINCFNYYEFDNKNKVAEVEMAGEIVHGRNKSVCSEITIVREIDWHEVLELVNSGNNNTGNNNTGNENSGNWNSGNRNSGNNNTGNWNSGNWNSGNWNSGNRNSGDRNSGNWNSGDDNLGYENSGYRNSGNRNSGNLNSGDWNSGDWNSCDNESGFLNSENSKIIRVFNKKCDISVWTNIIKPNFLYFQLRFFNENNELVKLEYKEAFRKSFLEAKEKKDWEEQKQLLLNLPNFNFEVFEAISGITKEEIEGEIK